MSSTATVDADTRVASGVPIGVDVGCRNVLALAPVDAGADVAESHVVDAPHLEAYYAGLQRRVDRDDVVAGALADRLEDVVDDAARDAIAYARTFDTPLLVLEDLSYPDRSLEECLATDAELDCWLFPAIQGRLTEQATALGISVVVTSEKFTTRQCHACDQFAQLDDHTIRCTTDDCPVGVVCRDRSAASSIAKRVASE